MNYPVYFTLNTEIFLPFPVDTLFKACVSNCLFAGIAGSNHAEGNGCLSIVSVVCCRMAVFVAGLSPVQRTVVCVYV